MEFIVNLVIIAFFILISKFIFGKEAIFIDFALIILYLSFKDITQIINYNDLILILSTAIFLNFVGFYIEHLPKVIKSSDDISDSLDIENLVRINIIMSNFSKICYIERDFGDLKGKIHKELTKELTILVIEDEEIVRKMMERMLVKSGYKVKLAKDGLEGLKIFRNYDNIIDMIILDLTMPVMSGEQCFKELIKINSKVPIVISSGYSGKDITIFTEYDSVEFLQKPFTINELNEKLLNMIDRI